jgi:spore maturation protein CgeB
VRSLRIAYFAHSLRSDWNNGNAHFLRGLLRALQAMGHDVIAFEPCTEWSIQHLREEEAGEASLQQLSAWYPELRINTYRSRDVFNLTHWRSLLRDRDVVILHEWNPPALAHRLLEVRDELCFRLLFHDTHHRASSTPDQIRAFGTDRFDGILCFGESLRRIYQKRFGIPNSYTLHEAADVTVFHPNPGIAKSAGVVWIGNWGDGERTLEIREFLLEPAAALRDRKFTVYGVRYPAEGLDALRRAGILYAGYLPNLEAPSVYAAAQATIHIPRQQYVTAMTGIPTVRVFEALACGIPLVSAPWCDTEGLFHEGDFLVAGDGTQMRRALELLLHDSSAARAQSLRGLETILSRHTCRHRAEELTCICEELLS